MNESDLYKPVNRYLTDLGYSVKGEVLNCDIIAKKDDDIIAVELKKSFNATLLIQAVERQKIADSVYIAIPKPSRESRVRNWKGMCHLLRRLELGLIVVSSSGKAEIKQHPSDGKIRKNNKRRRAIIREFDNRTGDFNLGGVSKKKILTVYREESIYVACCLLREKEIGSRRVRKLGGSDKSSRILRDNHYGWFDKIETGVYSISNKGISELEKYSEIRDNAFVDIDKLKAEVDKPKPKKKRSVKKKKVEKTPL